MDACSLRQDQQRGRARWWRPRLRSETAGSEQGRYILRHSAVGRLMDPTRVPNTFRASGIDGLRAAPHFSVSSAMNFPNAADVMDIGSTPKPVSRAFMRGSAATALISLLSVSITSVGVSFGAPTPYHWLAS